MSEDGESLCAPLRGALMFGRLLLKHCCCFGNTCGFAGDLLLAGWHCNKSAVRRGKHKLSDFHTRRTNERMCSCVAVPDCLTMTDLSLPSPPLPSTSTPSFLSPLPLPLFCPLPSSLHFCPPPAPSSFLSLPSPLVSAKTFSPLPRSNETYCHVAFGRKSKRWV